MDREGIKIALLGNSGVGKTCIISRFYDNTFTKNTTSTISANFVEKVITRGKDKYVLNIWDTAGQEKYQSLGRHFYKNAYIVLLVYDITNQKSLDSIKKTWYPDLQVYGEKCLVTGIIGNKSDLYENEDLADEEEARDFAKEIGAVFALVSAKNGSNVNQLFEDLLDRFLQKDIQDKVKSEMGSNFKLEEEKQKKKKCC